MKRILLSLAAAAITVGIGALALPTSGQADENLEKATDLKIPRGYRDWRFISVAHEEGNLNDIRATLGNDVAVQAYRENNLPLPEGTIIGRLAWKYVASDENNKAFGRNQSFIAGAPTNVQFIIKDSKRYASTGGWGFAQFTGGKAANEAVAADCFSCHRKASARDFVFTHYAP